MPHITRNKGASEALAVIFFTFLIVGGIGWYFYTYGVPPAFTINNETPKDCSRLVPKNPFTKGSDLYNGYEAGENGSECDQDSNVFVKGCLEYQSKVDVYNRCMREQE